MEGLKRAGSGSHGREKGRGSGKDACGEGPLPVSRDSNDEEFGCGEMGKRVWQVVSA